MRPIEQQLGLLSQQLIDLQQRATSLDIKLQDAVRELSTRITEASKPRTGSARSLESIVALVGIISSLLTLGLAVRKEARESAEARLRIRELELKLAQTLPAAAGT